MQDKLTTKLLQTRMGTIGTTGARTNPSKILFRIETDKVSGRCKYEERTCSA
jgi:hypothetical protein